jgi:hypothetical protein
LQINKILLHEMHVYAIIGCDLNCRSLVFSYLVLNISNFLADMLTKTPTPTKIKTFFCLFFRSSASKRIGDTKSINR